MNRRDFDILEENIQAALSSDEGTGDDLPKDTVPENLEELTPVIRALNDIGMEEPSVEAQNRSRTQTLAAAAALRANRPAIGSIPFLFRPVAGVLAVLILVFITGFGLLEASAETIPGDALYPIKRSAESLASAVSEIRADSPTKTIDLNQRRIDEIHKLLTLGRITEIQFDGVIEEINGNTYIITGLPVQTTNATLQINLPQLEEKVRVLGTTTSEATIAAEVLLPLELEIIGLVEEINGSKWIVVGVEFDIGDLERDPQIQVGDWVIIQLELDEGQQYLAVSLHSYLNPTPTSSPSKPTPELDEPEETPEGAEVEEMEDEIEDDLEEHDEDAADEPDDDEEREEEEQPEEQGEEGEEDEEEEEEEED